MSRTHADVASARPGRPFASLATRVLFFVFLSTFLSALAVTAISVHATRVQLREHVEESFPVVLARSGDRIVELLEQARHELAGIAEELVRSCAEPARCPDVVGDGALGAWLDAARRRAHVLAGLALLDADGRVRAEVGEDRSLPSDAFDPAGSLGVTVVSAGVARGAVLAAPLPGGDGRSLRGWVPLHRVEALLAGEARGRVQLYLADASGRVILRSAGAEPRSRMAAASLLGDRQVRDQRAPDGRAALVASSSLEPLPWTLVAESSFDAAFAPLFALLPRLVAIDLLAVLLSSLLAYHFTRSLLRPIQALSRGARSISEGDLAVEIPEPGGSHEIGLLTRTFNAMARRLRESREEIEAGHQRLQRQNDELQRANEVLEQLSITDGLTKLHNHRFFQDHLTREIRRVARTREPLSMLLVDIDDFKRLNDRLGHAAGDELLKGIARTLDHSVRESDFLARYGGEEFVILTASTDLAGAVHLAEKVRQTVAESSFIVDDSMQLVRVTVSIGVAEYHDDRKAFFRSADRALYQAKAEGKDRVVASEDERPAAAPPAEPHAPEP